MGTVYQEKANVTGKSMAVLLPFNFLQRVKRPQMVAKERVKLASRLALSSEERLLRRCFRLQQIVLLK